MDTEAEIQKIRDMIQVLQKDQKLVITKLESILRTLTGDDIPGGK